ncbi:MAG TPA: rod shape-determining protein MreC, partial [Bacillota bacterium]|nr:rod shape-determining protein MreC [Bacillota bacterium]
FRNKKFIMFFAVIFLLITWVMFVTSRERKEESKVEFFLNSAIAPLENVFSFSSKTVNDSWKNLAELARLKVENKKLQEQLSRLKTRQLSYTNLHNENDRLRDALQFEKNQIHEMIPAEIISVSPNNWSYTFIINKGSKHGLAKGLAVISPEGVVGRIGEIRKNSAEVILISDTREGNYIGGLVKRTNNMVIVRGGGDVRGQCTINPAIDSYFFDLKKNDLIITSDASEKFPSGIPIGRVIAVNKGSNKMAYQALIKPVVKLGKLQFVYVVKMIKRPPESIGEKEINKLLATPKPAIPQPTAPAATPLPVQTTTTTTATSATTVTSPAPVSTTSSGGQ